MNAETQKPAAVEPIDPQAVYPVEHASRLLRLHPVTLRKKARAGVIVGKRTLGSWRFKGSELLRHA